jgi:hypothetical protein
MMGFFSKFFSKKTIWRPSFYHTEGKKQVTVFLTDGTSLSTTCCDDYLEQVLDWSWGGSGSWNWSEDQKIIKINPHHIIYVRISNAQE